MLVLNFFLSILFVLFENQLVMKNFPVRFYQQRARTLAYMLMLSAVAYFIMRVFFAVSN